MRPQAHEVMLAWGFAYKSAFIWRKLTINGKPRMGTGYRVLEAEDAMAAWIEEAGSGVPIYLKAPPRFIVLGSHGRIELVNMPAVLRSSPSASRIVATRWELGRGVTGRGLRASLAFA
jgi:hypothetical protein